MSRALALVLLLGACAADPPPIQVAAIKPLPVIIETKTRIIVRDTPPPDVITPSLQRTYSAVKPLVDEAVVRSGRPSTITRLTALDRRVQRALQKLQRRHHVGTAAELDETIAAIVELRGGRGDHSQGAVAIREGVRTASAPSRC